MFNWRRVGGLPVQVVVFTVLVVLSTAATLGFLYVVIAGNSTGEAWSGVIFLAAFTAFGFRLGRVGVFVSTTGVRNRSMWQTQTMPWPDVKGFETRPMVSGAAAGPLRMHAVWILLKDSSALRTSLIFRSKSPLLKDKLTAILGDATSALNERGGTVVSDEAAQKALRELRAAREAAR